MISVNPRLAGMTGLTRAIEFHKVREGIWWRVWAGLKGGTGLVNQGVNLDSS